MDSGIFFHIVIAFFVAGLWISLASLASERLGSRLGGLLANLPSNILISLLFMALTRGEAYAAEAASSVPIGMAIDTLFLVAFVAALRIGLAAALLVSLLVWLGAASLAVALPPVPPLAALMIYAATCALSFAFVDAVLKVRAVAKRSLPFKPSVLVARALFAGAIVAAAVAAAQYAPPYLIGIVAVFPAVLFSTMTILTRAQGPDFARATGKVLILSSSNIIVYGAGVALLFPLIGPWWGSACAFAAAALYVALLLPLSKKIR
jgi:hypothetical protein